MLLIYEQDAQPCTVIALGNVNIEEPKFHQSDPALIIFDKSNSNYLFLKLFFGKLLWPYFQM